MAVLQLHLAKAKLKAPAAILNEISMWYSDFA